MRIRLGKFLLTRYWKHDKIPRNKFDAMINDPTMKGEVTKGFDGVFNVPDLVAGKLPQQIELEPLLSIAAPSGHDHRKFWYHSMFPEICLERTSGSQADVSSNHLRLPRRLVGRPKLTET